MIHQVQSHLFFQLFTSRSRVCSCCNVRVPAKTVERTTRVASLARTIVHTLTFRRHSEATNTSRNFSGNLREIWLATEQGLSGTNCARFGAFKNTAAGIRWTKQKHGEYRITHSYSPLQSVQD